MSKENIDDYVSDDLLNRVRMRRHIDYFKEVAKGVGEQFEGSEDKKLALILREYDRMWFDECKEEVQYMNQEEVREWYKKQGILPK